VVLVIRKPSCSAASRVRLARVVSVDWASVLHALAASEREAVWEGRTQPKEPREIPCKPCSSMANVKSTRLEAGCTGNSVPSIAYATCEQTCLPPAQVPLWIPHQHMMSPVSKMVAWSRFKGAHLAIGVDGERLNANVIPDVVFNSVLVLRTLPSFQHHVVCLAGHTLESAEGSRSRHRSHLHTRLDTFSVMA
jgi:hypothetical protein